MMWYDHCSLGKLRPIERLKGEVFGLSVDHAQEGGKSQSSPSWSPLSKHLPVQNIWSKLCQTDAPEDPSFHHRSLLPFTEASTSPLPLVPVKVQLQLSPQQDMPLLLLMQTWGVPQHSKPLAISALALTEGGKDAPCCFKSCLSSPLGLMSS